MSDQELEDFELRIRKDEQRRNRESVYNFIYCICTIYVIGVPVLAASLFFSKLSFYDALEVFMFRVCAIPGFIMFVFVFCFSSWAIVHLIKHNTPY